MIDGWLAAVEAAPMVNALRLSSWAYPAVNTLHIVGIALLFGAIVPLDLRLIGWRSSDTQLLPLSRLLLPVAVGGFVLAVLSGIVLFSTDARQYAASPLFLTKLAAIAAALVNVWFLRRIDWRARNSRFKRLRAAGMLSILLWLSAISLGRWIAYA